MTETVPSGQSPQSATLDCPKCQSTITYYDVTGSSYYGCPRCHTFFQYENEGPPQILASFSNRTTNIVLPIGTEGYLSGQFMRVVGFMHKKEADAAYDWTEYVLLRQDGQCVQLAEYNGHWMYIEPIKEKYKQYHTKGNAYYVDTEQRRYRLYHRYKAKVLNAIGEFDWNILEDERLSISEYINPPYMLIGERTDKDSDWYVATYVSRADVASAFAASTELFPDAYGVGVIQPDDPKDRRAIALPFAGLILALILLIQALVSFTKPSKQVFNAAYQTQPTIDSTSASFQSIVTPSFDVEGPIALAFDLHADLNNQWLELPMTLINEQTGKTYEFTKALEYYSGVEDGELWSEGSLDDDAVLSRIPSGSYHLNIYPATEAGKTATFTIRIEQTATLWTNIILLILLLGIYPLILYWRRQWYEYNRWSQSDFSDQEGN